MDKARLSDLPRPCKSQPDDFCDDETPSSLEDTPPTASRPERVSIVPEAYWSKSSCRSCTIHLQISFQGKDETRAITDQCNFNMPLGQHLDEKKGFVDLAHFPSG